MVYALVILALRRLKQEEHKFKTSLDYIVEPNFKNNKLRFWIKEKILTVAL